MTSNLDAAKGSDALKRGMRSNRIQKEKDPNALGSFDSECGFWGKKVF